MIENRFPNLGKLSVSIIENWAEPVLGKSAISEIKSPLIERQLLDSIGQALSKTEQRFIKEHLDKDVCDAIINLPLATLPSVLQAAREFYSRPTDNILENAISQQLVHNFSNVEPERLQFGVSTYINIFRQELANLSGEIREKLDTGANLNIQNNTERIVSSLEQLIQILSKKTNRNTEQDEVLQVHDNLRLGLKERKNIRRLGNAVYQAEALYAEGKLPNDLNNLLRVAREMYDQIRQQHGDLLTRMRFHDLLTCKEARDELSERLAIGERYFYDSTSNDYIPMENICAQASKLHEVASEQAFEPLISKINDNLSSNPFYVSQLIREGLELPFHDIHKRVLEQKMFEVELHIHSQEKSVAQFIKRELTMPEYELVKLAVTKDWTVRQIAKELNISVAVVDIQLGQIYEKLRNHLGLEQVNPTILTTILGSYWKNENTG